jgi:hypothetical protein
MESRFTVGSQLAKTVADCEAGLAHLGFAHNPFLYWIWWCLLACRWLVLLIQRFKHLKIGFAENLGATTAVECCMCK